MLPLASSPVSDLRRVLVLSSWARHVFLRDQRGISALNPGGAGAKPPSPGRAQHSLPTTHSQHSVFRLLCSQMQWRGRHKQPSPPQMGRPFIMHSNCGRSQFWRMTGNAPVTLETKLLPASAGSPAAGNMPAKTSSNLPTARLMYSGKGARFETFGLTQRSVAAYARTREQQSRLERHSFPLCHEWANTQTGC